MFNTLAIAAVGTVILTVGCLYVLDNFYNNYVLPNWFSERKVSVFSSAEQQCIRMMEGPLWLSLVTGLAIGAFVSYRQAESLLPLIGALGAVAIAWYDLNKSFHPNRNIILTWNHANKKVLLISILIAAFSGAVFAFQFGGVTPLLAGFGAACFALIGLAPVLSPRRGRWTKALSHSQLNG